MLKQFIRNFFKQKTVGMLNICSLSLGIMVSVIVGLWAITEFSFDDFHTNGDRIYRSLVNVRLNTVEETLPSTFKPLGKEAEDQIPDIEAMCRMQIQDMEIWIDNKVYPGNKIILTDDNFFTFFSFSLIDGNAKEALSAPEKVIISEAAATKYFPTENAIGKTIKYRGKDFNVAGIMKNILRNSHLQADLVFPFLKNWDENWGDSDNYYTYFLVKEGTDFPALNRQLSDILGNGLDFFKQVGASVYLELLKDMHFSSGVRNDGIVKGSKPLTIIFVFTAFVILILSCINFANLFVSTSFIRTKVIGIKKSQGASKASLVKEFYFETACYVIISIAVAIFLAIGSLPVFNQFTNSNLIIDFASPQLYIVLGVLLVFTVLLAGSFPALYMTKFGVIETLQSKFRGARISIFQKILIISQLSVSIVLLIIVSFMYKQVDFMISQDLGFDKENVIYVVGRDDFGEKYEEFRDELMKEPSITNISMKNSLPTDWVQGWTFKKQGAELESVMEVCRVKPDYFDFFDMKIITGENPFYLADADSLETCVINETAVRLLDMDDPVDKIIMANGRQLIVKGVVQDAQTRSFHRPIDPQVYFKLPDGYHSILFFKVKGDPARAINAIKNKWHESVPNIPFEYSYLDETYKKLYTAETNAGKVLIYAMSITFLITIAGLFAMAYYSIQRRIKEIGLRKVNGATIKDLLLLLNRDFVIWVAISFIIACPISYYCMEMWLDDFTVKTPLSFWVFLLVGLLAFLVALLTVSYQTWRVATMNPVRALKDE